MTYCEVGLARSFCWAYYWWESNKSRAKKRERGKEGRRRFFDGTNCQFRPIHRSSPPPRHAQAGFPSLRLLSPAGSGRGRVGYFTAVRAETTERASTLSDPDEVTRSISQRVWKSRANWRATFCGCQINCVSHKTFVPPIASSQTFRIDGAASRHRHHRRGGREREGAA